MRNKAFLSYNCFYVGKVTVLIRMLLSVMRFKISNEVLEIFKIILQKGKSVLLQVWSDPEGSRKLRFPDFTTTEQDGGMVVSLTHRPALPPGNTPGSHFC